MDWLSIIVTVLSNGFIIVIAGYFLNKKLEGYKKEIAIQIMKHQTLHARRAEAIEEIYAQLQKSIRYMAGVINPVQTVSDDIFKELVNEAGHIAQDFKEVYSAKKIFLMPALARQLDEIDSRMITLWYGFIRSNLRLNSDTTSDYEKWNKAWEAFNGKEIPGMFKKLEKEFRKLLGSDLD